MVFGDIIVAPAWETEIPDTWADGGPALFLKEIPAVWVGVPVGSEGSDHLVSTSARTQMDGNSMLKRDVKDARAQRLRDASDVKTCQAVYPHIFRTLLMRLVISWR